MFCIILLLVHSCRRRASDLPSTVESRPGISRSLTTDYLYQASNNTPMLTITCRLDCPGRNRNLRRIKTGTRNRGSIVCIVRHRYDTKTYR